MNTNKEKSVQEEDELVNVEIKYVKANSIEDLQKQVNKALNDGWDITENNPIYDELNKVWIEKMIYRMYESELDKGE